MLTSQFITQIHRDCNGSFSRPEILNLINQAQMELWVDSGYTQVLPYPTLNTVDGTLSYNLPVGIRNVRSIITKSQYSGGYTRSWGARAGENYYKSPDVPQEFFEVPIRCKQATDVSTQATITFLNNPGGTTGTYQLIAYGWPTALVTEADPLSIPSQYQMQILRTKVMQYIGERNFGNDIYWVEMYKKQYPEWLAFLNSGASGKAHSISVSRTYG